jgi:hypothetical protein
LLDKLLDLEISIPAGAGLSKDKIEAGLENERDS